MLLLFSRKVSFESSSVGGLSADVATSSCNRSCTPEYLGIKNRESRDGFAVALLMDFSVLLKIQARRTIAMDGREMMRDGGVIWW